MNTVEWSVVKGGLTMEDGVTQQILLEGGVWLSCQEVKLIADEHRGQADAILELLGLEGQGSSFQPCKMRVALRHVIGAYSRVPKSSSAS